jgi:hypothetical protein
VPAGAPQWVSQSDGALLEGTRCSQAMVVDFVMLPLRTPLLGAARALADAQASQVS